MLYGIYNAIVNQFSVFRYCLFLFLGFSNKVFSVYFILYGKLIAYSNLNVQQICYAYYQTSNQQIKAAERRYIDIKEHASLSIAQRVHSTEYTPKIQFTI